MTFGDRLRHAINRSDTGVMGFVAAMELTGIKGSTYPAIRRYMKNETEPTLSFAIEAARVLDVDFSWLATGQSSEAYWMLDSAHEAVAAARRKVEELDDWLSAVRGTP